MATKENPESINLADVKAQVEAMLLEARQEVEKAREEAAKIVADAKAQVSGELTEEQKKAIEKEKAYYDEYVEIELFKDNGRYKDDVTVSVNGETCLVQRGKKVKIKRKFAQVLEDSRRQNLKTSDFISMKARELEEKESKL